MKKSPKEAYPHAEDERRKTSRTFAGYIICRLLREKTGFRNRRANREEIVCTARMMSVSWV